MQSVNQVFVMGCGFWMFNYFPLRLLLGREGMFRAGPGSGRMGSDHGAGSANLCHGVLV